VPDEASSAAASTTEAPAAADEQHAIDDKIHEFLDNQQAKLDAQPAPDAAPAPASDEPAEEPTNSQTVYSGPPPDEPESEIAKDDAAPDMGELSIQQVAEAQEQAAQPNLPPPPPQSEGDKVVSNAINDMAATTGATPPAPAAPAAPAATEAPAQTPGIPGNGRPLEDREPTGPDAFEKPSTEAKAPMHAMGGHFSSRTITPPTMGAKPDINQLLSAEEARTGAAQAGGAVPPPPNPNDPNNISL
jgi:hypothetical protein